MTATLSCSKYFSCEKDIAGADGHSSTHDDEAVWASDTCGHGDEVYLAVQDDGNVVLYKGEDDEAEAIWATSTNQI